MLFLGRSGGGRGGGKRRGTFMILNGRGKEKEREEELGVFTGLQRKWRVLESVVET